MRLATESSRCSGCKVCLTICALSHFGENNPKKGALRVEGKFPVPGVFEVAVCNQCGECAKVCPVDAIRESDGVYILHREDCISCMNCVPVCPFNVLIVHNSESAPIKCDNCGDCVRYCPREAIVDAERVLTRIGG
ncbi:MAG: 4Fe-4S binding protein [Firmicutes bacterium]|nr:4Fe-4S binding protein [Dethiobacter sp.]MBS3887892.1 4Fe-4S binding protein [Bacillota bacterium]MBS4053862.1 4Fe-4S binding protein [Thermaerobacter sp.]